MFFIEDELTEWMKGAACRAFPDNANAMSGVAVVQSSSSEFGDYQCNSAMPLAKVLKRSPRDISTSIVDALDPNPAVANVDVAGPGFINIRLSDRYLESLLGDIMSGESLSAAPEDAAPLMVMDYSSPNFAKPMHIGHIRSAVIGNALDRMHRFLGYRVVADNHLGDWGTQCGILIMGYRHFVDAGALEESPVEELERVYVKSYERSREDEDWLNKCRNELVKLQSGDPENVEVWKKFVDLSMGEFNRVYERLGVRFDLVRGESYYRDRLDSVVTMLIEKGIARESDGAIVCFLEDEKLPPCIVRKSDGGFNYATTDIATMMSRVEEFSPDSIVYVTDERQQLHFRQVFAVCSKLGIEAAPRHVWFGLMRLPEGTFSTREGNVIKLEMLLDEAEKRALDVVRNSSPDMASDQQAAVARAVGLGAVKYVDLSQNPQSLVTFTWEKALSLDGNSAPYLQYACARIGSVLDKYRERFPDSRLEDFPVRLDDPLERDLAMGVARFFDVVRAGARSFRPNYLADYLYDLAGRYSRFYQNVPFLKAPEGVRESRVRLCGAVARVLRTGLGLLGIETPDRI